jgi:hypothetical protein
VGKQGRVGYKRVQKERSGEKYKESGEKSGIE